MIEITFSPASQTSFSNYAIKSKQNIKSPTDELITTDEVIIIHLK